MDIKRQLYRWWKHRGVPVPCADETLEFCLPRYHIYGVWSGSRFPINFTRLPEVVRFLRSFCGEGTVQLTFFELRGFTVEVAKDGWVVITPYTNESAQSLKLFNTGFALPAPRIWTYQTTDGGYTGRTQIFWEPSTGSLHASGWTYIYDNCTHSRARQGEVTVKILEPANAKPQSTVSRLLRRRANH